MKTNRSEERPKVLIVDDELLNVKLLEAYLQDEEYRISTASCGADALRLIHEAPPDLVLLDLMMPGMHGLEVCARIKENDKTSSISVVIVTALEQKSSKHNALQAGADEVIFKPVDKTEILRKIREVLKKKKVQDAASVRGGVS